MYRGEGWSKTRFTLGKPPVLTRSGLMYGAFFGASDLAASLALVVLDAVAAASVVVGLAVSVGDCAVGWGEGEGEGGDATLD
jgi:hypothetical protein